MNEPRDVRMRGFAERADQEEVDAFLREHTTATRRRERVGLLECVGRVLAEPVVAAVDVPGFPRSAMDGYAVRGEETFGASDYDPIAFELIGSSLPGAPFDADEVRAGTGGADHDRCAPVPDGADSVVMAEVCHETDERGSCRGQRAHCAAQERRRDRGGHRPGQRRAGAWPEAAAAGCRPALVDRKRGGLLRAPATCGARHHW